MNKAKTIMLEAIKEDIASYIDEDKENYSNTRIMVAYTYDKDAALELKAQLQEEFPQHEIICDPLSLSVACHIGPHSLAIAACKKIN